MKQTETVPNLISTTEGYFDGFKLPWKNCLLKTAPILYVTPGSRDFVHQKAILLDAEYSRSKTCNVSFGPITALYRYVALVALGQGIPLLVGHSNRILRMNS